MDCLRFIIDTSQIYLSIVPLLKEGLQKTQVDTIVDLCSGGGGPLEQIQSILNQGTERKIKIILTDKFPNAEAFKLISDKAPALISFERGSIDATNVPQKLSGFRTVFSAIHHFNKKAVESILKDAVKAKQGIGIFDGGDFGLITIIGIVIIHPFIFLFCTPFLRPFRVSRFLFTYIIPLIPICQIWDGVISITRLYKPEELLKIAKSIDNEQYIWKAGIKRNKFGIHASYLIGYPKHNE